MNFKLIRLKSKTKQKQKLSQRTVALAAILFLSVSSLCTMLFFNLNQPARMQAKTTTKPTVIVVKNPKLISDKSIDAPETSSLPASNSQSIYVRAIKSLKEAEGNQLQ